MGWTLKKYKNYGDDNIPAAVKTIIVFYGIWNEILLSWNAFFTFFLNDWYCGDISHFSTEIVFLGHQRTIIVHAVLN